MRTKLLLAAVSIAVAGTAQAEMAPGNTALVVRNAAVLTDDQQLVSFADLDLHSATGQRVLHERVRGAIASLCDRGAFSIADPTGPMKCSKAAWDDVSPDLARLALR